MAERDIRALLKERVESYGGEVRAVAWIGRRHAPDVLVLFPAGSLYSRSYANGEGVHEFNETKAPGGHPSEGQEREHARMRAAGCTVRVTSTQSQLDAWLPTI